MDTFLVIFIFVNFLLPGYCDVYIYKTINYLSECTKPHMFATSRKGTPQFKRVVNHTVENMVFTFTNLLDVSQLIWFLLDRDLFYVLKKYLINSWIQHGWVKMGTKVVLPFYESKLFNFKLCSLGPFILYNKQFHDNVWICLEKVYIGMLSIVYHQSCYPNSHLFLCNWMRKCMAVVQVTSKTFLWK